MPAYFLDYESQRRSASDPRSNSMFQANREGRAETEGVKYGGYDLEQEVEVLVRNSGTVPLVQKEEIKRWAPRFSPLQSG